MKGYIQGSKMAARHQKTLAVLGYKTELQGDLLTVEVTELLTTVPQDVESLKAALRRKAGILYSAGPMVWKTVNAMIPGLDCLCMHSEESLAERAKKKAAGGRKEEILAGLVAELAAAPVPVKKIRVRKAAH